MSVATVNGEPSAEVLGIEAEGDHMPGLLVHHLRDLRASGLSDAMIAASGIYSESNYDKLARLANYRAWPKRQGSAMVIPYRDAEGEAVLQRLKPDNPPTQQGKIRKYLTPKGAPNFPYFPPGVAGKLGDTSCELLIVEGEKKALKGTQEGFHTIGLSGIWNWKSNKSEQLLPALQKVKFQGRKVYIVFDSDIGENKHVADAAKRLGAQLANMGADVRLVLLPPGPIGQDGKPSKVGLDDYLVAHGPAELRKLLDAAEPPDPVDPHDVKVGADQIEPCLAAQKFLAEHETDGLPHLRFHRGAWRYHNGGCYGELETSEVKAGVVLSINRDYVKLTTGILGNVIAQVQAQSIIPSRIGEPAWLGPPPVDWPASEVLATRRELIHIPTLTSGSSQYSIPATPRFFSSTALDYDFAIDAPAPTLWLSFMQELWPDDSESIGTLQEWFGYLLTPDTSLQKILMLIGPPRSGKGTIARVLERLIGQANVAGPTLASFETNFGLQPLLGKSLAIIADARLSGRVDQSKVVERLLSISGEDSLTVDRKHREPVTGKIPARLMIVSNELPRLSESSGALAHRMIVLRLTQDFMGREDTQLTEKLLGELPGILLWAIQGWQRLHCRGRFIQPEAGKDLASEMKDLSSPIGMFLRQGCQVGPQYCAPVDDVYEAWCEWCKANGRDHAGTKQTFGRDVRAAVPSLKVTHPRDDSGRYRQYEGIGLADF